MKKILYKPADYVTAIRDNLADFDAGRITAFQFRFRNDLYWNAIETSHDYRAVKDLLALDELTRAGK